MRQLAWRIASQAAAKVGHQNTQQQIAQTGFGVLIAQLCLHQRPKGWQQVIDGNVLPGFGLRIQVRHTVHHHARIQLLQHGKQIWLVGTRQHCQHLGIQIGCGIGGHHQALEAIHPVFGAQELGTVFQVLAQALFHQAQVFQQNGG